MNKVIKVTEDEVFVGKADGSVVKTDKSNASWDVQIGDQVEIFTSGDMLILNLISQSRLKKKKVKSSFSKKIINLCRKVFPIAFTSLFLFFLTALIVIVSVPRGWKYTYEEEVGGVYVSCSIRFEDKNYLVMSSEVAEFDRLPEKYIQRMRYRIENGKLYIYSEEDEGFMYCGKINSMEIDFIDEEVMVNLKEDTMSALKVISIVFMCIFAVLDFASIVVFMLIKNGTIKIEADKGIIESNIEDETSKTAE